MRGRFETVGIPTFLGLAHFLADGSAGWMVGELSGRSPATGITFGLLLYNILAFGLQPVVGSLVDRLRSVGLGPLAASGLALVALGLLVFWISPLAGLAFAGLGSAFFHVGAGGLALEHSTGDATIVGIFTAPGVLGLAAGGGLAAIGCSIVPVAVVGLLIASFIVAGLRPALAAARSPRRPEPGPAWHPHDLVMAALLLAIAVRSLVWTAFNDILAGHPETLALLAASAALGKVAGGYLADRLGHRTWCLASLLASAVILGGGFGGPMALAVGVALLQSSTPAMLVAVWRRMPGSPGTAAGLGLGLAIAIGGLPIVSGFRPPPGLSWPTIAVQTLSGAACLITWAFARLMPVASAPSESPL